MPEFFMPAPTAPIPATAGSAGSSGTRKRYFFGIEILPCSRHSHKYFEVNHYIYQYSGLISLPVFLLHLNICNDFFNLLWKFKYLHPIITKELEALKLEAHLLRGRKSDNFSIQKFFHMATFFRLLSSQPFGFIFGEF
jgi:hypothetical protein